MVLKAESDLITKAFALYGSSKFPWNSRLDVGRVEVWLGGCDVIRRFLRLHRFSTQMMELGSAMELREQIAIHNSQFIIVK